MPPRPFPFALGIGTDICCISRIRELITKKPQNASLLPFVKKVLTIREQDDFFHRFRHVAMATNGDLTPITRYLAGRWAAKEAVIKAVGHRRLTLRDVEIFQKPVDEHEGLGVYALICDEVHRKSHSEASAPSPSVADTPRGDGLPSRLIFHKLDGQIAKVSISHDGDYAAAVCLAADEPLSGDVGGEAAARTP
ncbi:hypothetical protein CLAFUW4_08449 [Fulvia fulva]|uniref:4'-phosphopantetheinyl transferase domain-containing protein n=1 Tax=Passalora fulva TaxID=5499 RepID=A0A9Q8P6Y1_PASFU|nr:uncharacterized protein CLAFUR5_08553 [Fulvia fulva]KAK4629572.1 hypothetical protein CLAFUR4_08454 [Fulvia fulva]KAK4630490.1 hypothetical protein CLAFUR0_08449 [Fulvia fulva]UJO15494.1 hypothetical protein CLAFUR5_08553 [Fulvia fulva]WPV12605.1 hypothetical protein CLAFUW4_08449 [Fulvia fulva]WPV27285.1 hypothetical protein CLAFUW7_08449 [Fulvia fulva]